MTQIEGPTPSDILLPGVVAFVAFLLLRTACCG